MQSIKKPISPLGLAVRSSLRLKFVNTWATVVPRSSHGPRVPIGYMSVHGRLGGRAPTPTPAAPYHWLYAQARSTADRLPPDHVSCLRLTHRPFATLCHFRRSGVRAATAPARGLVGRQSHRRCPPDREIGGIERTAQRRQCFLITHAP